jgi:hypothetical protein
MNFEMSVGGSGRNVSQTDADTPLSHLGCGVRMKSSSTLVYYKCRFHDAGSTMQGAGADTCTEAEAEVCASATDLSSKSNSECNALTTFSSSLPYLNYSQLKGTASPAVGYSLGFDIIKGKGMPTLTSFITEAATK